MAEIEGEEQDLTFEDWGESKGRRNHRSKLPRIVAEEGTLCLACELAWGAAVPDEVTRDKRLEASARCRRDSLHSAPEGVAMDHRPTWHRPRLLRYELCQLFPDITAYGRDDCVPAICIDKLFGAVALRGSSLDAMAVPRAKAKALSSLDAIVVPRTKVKAGERRF